MTSLIVGVLAAIPLTAQAPPCTTGTRECQEKITLGPPGRYSLVYRSHSIETRNPNIERALIVVHGAGRNADNYFASAMAGAFLAGQIANALVIAPRFASNSGGECRDTLDAGEISWTCGSKEDWRGGGEASGLAGVHTFDLIDLLIAKLARRETFPNLKHIVVTGHSAGGQFVHRYAAAGSAERSAGVPIHYIVANPSTYLYLDDRRLASGACSEKSGCSGRFLSYNEGRNCTTYNNWRNGLEERGGYARPISDADLKAQLVARDVTYLLGELDTLPKYGFDGSCPAMAQGSDRLARGMNYWNYINSEHGARHKLVVVSACGHNGRCMYTADAALPLLFPK